jgi:hypothetical protein
MRTRLRSYIAVALVGLLAVAGSTVFELAKRPAGCVPGPLVASTNETLTPFLVVSSPYLGSAEGTVTIQNDTREVSFFPENGSAIGYFERINWTESAGKPSSGSGASCQGLLFIGEVDQWSSTTFPLSNGTTYNFTNDSIEPNYEETGLSGGPVYFSAGFSHETSQLTTCGTAASIQNVTSHSIRVGVAYRVSTAWEIVNTTLDEATNYTYSFPANSGTWAIDNLSLPGGPGGGWAFAYLGSCT